MRCGECLCQYWIEGGWVRCVCCCWMRKKTPKQNLWRCGARERETVSSGRHFEPPRDLASCQNSVLMTLPECLVLQEMINCTIDSRKQEVITYGIISALQSVSRALGQFVGEGACLTLGTVISSTQTTSYTHLHSHL